MATAAQISEVRDYVGEPAGSTTWTDVAIGAYIDRGPTPLHAAAAIWGAKAAAYADQVNVSESGSSRSLGSLIDNALRMASYYEQRATVAQNSPPATLRGPVIRSIRRP